jgi:hypothetical protein
MPGKEERGDRGGAEEVLDLGGDPLPVRVGLAGIAVRAARAAEEAVSLAPLVVEGGHDLVEGHRVSGAGEAEATAGAEGGSEDAGAAELVEGLRQVVAGDVEGDGHLGDVHRAVAFGGLAGEVEDGAEGVFGGLREHGGWGGGGEWGSLLLIRS